MRVFNLIVERDLETGVFVGSIPGWPGAHTQGTTLEELETRMREVIEMLLEDGEPVLASEFVALKTVRVRDDPCDRVKIASCRTALIHRRGELPDLDPAKLGLPISPEVAEIRTSTYLNAIGENGLEILVLVGKLTPEQEVDLSWTYSLEDRIRSYLEDEGEERFPLILFRKVGTKRTKRIRSGRIENRMARMKSYATFDLYLADQPAKNQRIIRALRALMKRTLPKLEEAVKWGNGCWVKGNLPVAYVYSDKEWVQFGFTRGSALADPLGLLEGEGAYVRHVKVRRLEDIDEKAFGALAREAEKVTVPIPRKSPARPRAKKKAKRAAPARRPSRRA